MVYILVLFLFVCLFFLLVPVSCSVLAPCIWLKLKSWHFCNIFEMHLQCWWNLSYLCSVEILSAPVPPPWWVNLRPLWSWVKRSSFQSKSLQLRHWILISCTTKHTDQQHNMWSQTVCVTCGQLVYSISAAVRDNFPLWFTSRADILSLLRTYNCYHEGKNFQLRTREVRMWHLTGGGAGTKKKTGQTRAVIGDTCSRVWVLYTE